MYKLPIALPPGQRVMLTQPFGPTTVSVEPVGPNGEPHFHYGIDLVTGDDHHTYGVALVCPFASASVERDVYDGAMTKVSNYRKLCHTDSDGMLHELVLMHVSALAPGVEFNEGEHVANIGNAGLVTPAPSLLDPYAGAHLHMEYYQNGVIQDPLRYFDITSPYGGTPTPQALEMPPANWLVDKLLELIKPFTNNTNYGNTA